MDGATTRVANLQAIIRSKQTANRDKDLRALFDEAGGSWGHGGEQLASLWVGGRLDNEGRCHLRPRSRCRPVLVMKY